MQATTDARPRRIATHLPVEDKDTRGEDQDQLCQSGLRGLGSMAIRVAARGAILVRPAYLPAPYPPPVRTQPAAAKLQLRDRGPMPVEWVQTAKRR